MYCSKSVCCICLSSNQEEQLTFLSGLDGKQQSCYRALVQTECHQLLEEDCNNRMICTDCSDILQNVTLFRIKCINNSKTLSDYHSTKCDDTNQESEVQFKVDSLKTMKKISVGNKSEELINQSLKIKEERINEEFCIKEEVREIQERSIQKTLPDFVNVDIKNEDQSRLNYHSPLFEHINLDVHSENEYLNEDSHTIETMNKEMSRKRNQKSACKLLNTGITLLHSDSNAHWNGMTPAEHTAETCIECDVCGNTFNFQSDFIRHWRIHNDLKPFKCEVCSRGFNRKLNLIVHKRTHTGEKLYKCEICGKSFTHNTNLVVHRRTHTGERLYKCEMCDKAFSHNTNLVVHRRTHTGERPFACELCNKTFNQKSNLMRHIRTHTTK